MRPLRTVPCSTCGAMPTDIFPDGSPRYDHGHDFASGVISWHKAPSSSAGSRRRCPACGHHHVVGTTCLECPSCGYGIDLTEIARVIFGGDSDANPRGSHARRNGPDRYLWTEGCSDDGLREYHW